MAVFHIIDKEFLDMKKRAKTEFQNHTILLCYIINAQSASLRCFVAAESLAAETNTANSVERQASKNPPLGI